MIHAYSETYLDDAMQNLGEMLDYAVNSCYLDMDDFFEMFIVGGIASQFDNGVPGIVSGKSGTELVWEVLSKAGVSIKMSDPREDRDCSPEYWCGWIIAFYQWYTALSFKEILQICTMREIRKMYYTLHEASELKFVNTMNEIARRKKLPTKLQTLRKSRQLSQKLLSEKSGVTLRMIQQYENRSKDINRAAAETLSALSRVLGCNVEDLLEYSFEEVTIDEVGD